MPNLFKKVPKKRIQAGRGNARRRDSNVGSMVFMAKEKACRPFGKQAGKILVGVVLDSFLLLAGVMDLKARLPGRTGDASSHLYGPDSALAKIICSRQLHLLRGTMPSIMAVVKRPFHPT